MHITTRKRTLQQPNRVVIKQVLPPSRNTESVDCAGQDNLFCWI